MEPPRHIEGYYYDEAKKKYFKVLPNHAGRVGSQHTSDGVKRRKRIYEAAEEKSRQIKARNGRVLRAQILRGGSLGGGLLAREYGNITVSTSRIIATQALVRDWSLSEILSSRNQPLPDNAFREASEWTTSMAGFAYDAATQALYYDACTVSPIHHSFLHVIRCGDRIEPPIHQPYRRYHRSDSIGLYGHDSYITAIELEPSSRALLSTAHSEALVVTLADPLDFDDPEEELVVHMELFGLDGDPEIFTACAASPTSRYLFAIGSTRGIHAIDKQLNLSLLCNLGDTSVLAIAPFQDQCFISGERNGTIRVYDPRTRRLEPDKMFHPSAVRHIRQVGTHTIVVAGLKSTLCNYDTRYPKSGPLASSWPMLPVNQSQIRNPTAPTVKYPKYQNDAYLNMGFDVDLDDGLVAAVVQKHRLGCPLEIDQVNIFSSHTGELLQTLDPENAGCTNDPARTKALRFVAERGESMPKSLWVAKGHKMISYEW